MAIALSLPPFGWWPLGVVGLGALATVLYHRPAGRRATLGASLGFGQYAIGLWWVTEFNVGGYVALLVLSMVFTAAAGAIVGSRRWIGVLVGLPAALMAGDWARGHFPFGGLPLGGIALGQAAGPLVPVARLGGPILVTGVTATGGVGLAILVTAGVGVARRLRRETGSAGPGGVGVARRLRQESGSVGSGGVEAASGRRTAISGCPFPGREIVAGLIALGVVVALVAGGRLGPDGAASGVHRTVSVAAVQGGGTRGLHAADVDPEVVFRRQVDLSNTLRGPLDLVVWPEDVIRVEGPIASTPEAAEVGRQAARLGVTVVAGVVEDVGTDRFRNAAVAWSPAGVIVARYDKVHRVPFGEYIPGRSLFRHVANLDLVPRDAIAGHGPGVLGTPAGPLGTVISYEVFFEDRARSAIHAGGELLIVPTNASSYRTSQVPAQEVAAAQLRAWETGRDTVQAAPTGFSALIDHDGRILARTTLGRQEAITGQLTLRHGRTLFVRLGDIPVLVLAVIGLIAATRLAPRPR